jgi:hypothetical protein
MIPLLYKQNTQTLPHGVTALVELLQFILRCKEWHHTLHNLSLTDFQKGQDLKFLIYTDDFCDSLDDSKMQHDSSSNSDDDSSAGLNSHVLDGK